MLLKRKSEEQGDYAVGMGGSKKKKPKGPGIALVIAIGHKDKHDKDSMKKAWPILKNKPRQDEEEEPPGETPIDEQSAGARLLVGREEPEPEPEWVPPPKGKQPIPFAALLRPELLSAEEKARYADSIAAYRTAANVPEGAEEDDVLDWAQRQAGAEEDE